MRYDNNASLRICKEAPAKVTFTVRQQGHAKHVLKRILAAVALVAEVIG